MTAYPNPNPYPNPHPPAGNNGLGNGSVVPAVRLPSIDYGLGGLAFPEGFSTLRRGSLTDPLVHAHAHAHAHTHGHAHPGSRSSSITAHTLALNNNNQHNNHLHPNPNGVGSLDPLSAASSVTEPGQRLSVVYPSNHHNHLHHQQQQQQQHHHPSSSSFPYWNGGQPAAAAAATTGAAGPASSSSSQTGTAPVNTNLHNAYADESLPGSVSLARRLSGASATSGGGSASASANSSGIAAIGATPNKPQSLFPLHKRKAGAIDPDTGEHYFPPLLPSSAAASAGLGDHGAYIATAAAKRRASLVEEESEQQQQVGVQIQGGSGGYAFPAPLTISSNAPSSSSTSGGGGGGRGAGGMTMAMGAGETQPGFPHQDGRHSPHQQLVNYTFGRTPSGSLVSSASTAAATSNSNSAYPPALAAAPSNPIPRVALSQHASPEGGHAGLPSGLTAEEHSRASAIFGRPAGAGNDANGGGGGDVDELMDEGTGEGGLESAAGRLLGVRGSLYGHHGHHIKETPYSRSPELKISHKMAERKRRKEMKELFDDLRDSIPAERGVKASKWEVLTKAIEYIALLSAERDEIVRNSNEHINSLENSLAAARNQLALIQQQQQQGHQQGHLQSMSPVSAHSVSLPQHPQNTLHSQSHLSSFHPQPSHSQSQSHSQWSSPVPTFNALPGHPHSLAQQQQQQQNTQSQHHRSHSHGHLGQQTHPGGHTAMSAPPALPPQTSAGIFPSPGPSSSSTTNNNNKSVPLQGSYSQPPPQPQYQHQQKLSQSHLQGFAAPGSAHGRPPSIHSHHSNHSIHSIQSVHSAHSHSAQQQPQQQQQQQHDGGFPLHSASASPAPLSAGIPSQSQQQAHILHGQQLISPPIQSLPHHQQQQLIQQQQQQHQQGMQGRPDEFSPFAHMPPGNQQQHLQPASNGIMY